MGNFETLKQMSNNMKQELKSGIPEFDNAVEQYEIGEINFLELTCRLWNTAYAMGKIEQLNKSTVINWVAFDFFKYETRPNEYGKYLICRKDGKIHWETWNGNGWAYNHNEVRFWAVINKPPYL